MDGRQFDDLVRRAAGATRRAVLGGFLAGLAGFAGPGEAGAAPNDRRCAAGENACRERRAVLCGGSLRRPCLCFTGTDKTVCGDAASPAPCRPCRTDADCTRKTGRGSVCIALQGECGCQPGFRGRRTCVAPCPR